MKILIVSATNTEIDKFPDLSDKDVDFFVTGIGAPLTILKLSKLLNEKRFDLIINVGIAGSYNKDLPIGTVVEVISDQFADIGFEDNNKFIKISETNFKESAYEVLKSNRNVLSSDFLKLSGISVNSVSGSANTISLRQDLFKADIETMEGAAVFLVANEFNTACVQIRAISNYVELRDSSQWNIPLAIKNLSQSVLELIENFQKIQTL